MFSLLSPHFGFSSERSARLVLVLTWLQSASGAQSWRSNLSQMARWIAARLPISYQPVMKSSVRGRSSRLCSDFPISLIKPNLRLISGGRLEVPHGAQRHLSAELGEMATTTAAARRMRKTPPLHLELTAGDSTRKKIEKMVEIRRDEEITAVSLLERPNEGVSISAR